MNKSDEDFGFSLVDDDFVAPKAKEMVEAVTKSEGYYKERRDELMHLIMPLVDNLCVDPDKTTIYWPNRVQKMKEFRDKLISAAGNYDLGNGK